MDLRDIATSTDGTSNEWTRKTPTLSFRVDMLRRRLYRREESKAFFGGYRDQYVSLENEQLVREWLA